MPVSGNRVRTQAVDGFGAMGEIRLTYDFAVHGGAISTINLGVDKLGTSPLSVTLPQGACIIDGFYDVLTALAGAGASIALSSGEAAGDLLAATLITTAGTLGRKAITPADTAATIVKTTTATRIPNIVISGGALTAGKLVLVLRYVVTG